MPANFSAVWEDCGFLTGTPPFLFIPRENLGLVFLNGVRSLDVNQDLKFDRSRLSVKSVTPGDLHNSLLRYTQNFPSSVMGDVLSLAGGMLNKMRFGSTLLAIEARISSHTISLDYVTKNDRAKMDVYAASRNTVAVSFLFIRYPDTTGQLGGTTLVPAYASELIGMLNRLYMPSVNIELRLKSSRYVDLPKKLGSPISRDSFLNNIAQNRDAEADMTVFFAGKYIGTGGILGEAFSDIDSVIVDDSPSQYSAPKTAWPPGSPLTDEQVDSFADPSRSVKSTRDLYIVLAHEIAHLFGAKHNNERDSLMTMSRQDFKFSKDTVMAVSQN